MSINILPLSIHRLDEAFQVWETCLGSNFKLDRQEVTDRLQNSTGLFYIAQDGYNETYQVYQIYITLDAIQANLDTLRSIQARFPQVNIQFFFEKTLTHNE